MHSGGYGISVMAYKWAIFVSVGSVAVKWGAFFLAYDRRSPDPIWLSFPIPIIIAVPTYFAWDTLKPESKTEVEG